MRIGELLVDHGWCDPQSVQRAVAEQRHTGKRLCSLLISRGLLDPDHAARALGEQHAVPAILQRHLENRDTQLAPLLPSPLARASIAIPIGRNREGDLIVCVRDPRPELLATLVQILGEHVVMAVCPATQLERLVDLAYEPTPSEEYEVDLSTGPRASIGGKTPTSLTDLGTIQLVDLDDSRVTKDFSQSGVTLPPLTHANRSATLPPRTRPAAMPAIRPAGAMTIDAAIAAIDAATSRDLATELAMRYAQTRWSSSLLLAIREGAALGLRGHGAQLTPEVVETIALPLSSPSIVTIAHDMRRLAVEGSGAVHDRLVRLLGSPRTTMAAPISIATRVACVLVVGGALGAGEPARDLEQVAEALGDAYTRFLHANEP